MRGIACVAASRLIARRRVGLSTAERLRLEDHLTACDPCRSEARDVATLAALSDTSSSTLNERQRDRALGNALAAIAADLETTRATVPTRSTRRRWVLAGVAMACAAGIALSVLPRGDAPSAARPEANSAADRLNTDRLIDGNVTVAGIALSAGDPKLAGIALSADDTKLAGIALSAQGPVSAATEIVSDRGATVALAHGRLALHDATTIRWDRSKSMVTLVEGSVHAEITPDRERPFRVATEQFTVHVVGTAFDVTPNSVRVSKGVVRVVASSGKILVARLEAGQSWRIEHRTATAPVKRAPVATESRDTAATRTTPRRVAASAATLLARARGLLAQGKVRDARRLVRRARSSAPSRAARAEADTLLAECELVSGDLASAARLYLVVAGRYKGSSAGQNALFAAARLESRRGNKDSARRLLERYISSYPSGRFQGEAKRRLDALGQ